MDVLDWQCRQVAQVLLDAQPPFKYSHVLENHPDRAIHVRFIVVILAHRYEQFGDALG